LYEGLGMVAVEAQTSGLPCALSNRVPEEAKVIDDVEFLPLSASADTWMHTIMLHNAIESRENTSNMCAEIWDICVEVGKLAEIYLNARVNMRINVYTEETI
jgi:hypothetical protein